MERAIRGRRAQQVAGKLDGRPMARYLVWRVFQILPMLWLVGTALFILVQLTPGGPVIALGGEFADRATVASIERQLGLDRPVG